MALSLVAVGAKITAAITNSIINLVNANASTMVVPTSVAGTGVSVTSLGKVTLSAATTASLNGVFTGTYDNYLIVCNLTLSVAGLIKLVFRAGGTDNTSANYSYQAVQGSGATASSAGITAQAAVFLTNQVGLSADCDASVYAPALAANTRYASKFYAVNGATQAAGLIAGALGVATAVDGITLTPSAGGTMTGTVRVYGINNG